MVIWPCGQRCDCRPSVAVSVYVGLSTHAFCWQRRKRTVDRSVSDVARERTFYLLSPAKWNALHGALHIGRGHLLFTSLAAHSYLPWHDRNIEYPFHSHLLLGSHHVS